jgi:DNA-binding transcriptional MocR family regulator
LFSERIDSLRPSPIRTILAAIDSPGMISFAGGLPASEMLPNWSGNIPRDALQYGPTQGEMGLRAMVSEQLCRLGIDAQPERVLITAGSQQGIDLMAKLFVDRGTAIAVESPTYLAALQVFGLYGAQFVELNPENPIEARLLYVVPTFANPTGRCATDAERDTLARVCRDTQMVLFEDDPYRDLAYDSCERTPIAARMDGGSWVYQGSFSKTFAPGLRLGFLAASEEIFERLVILKQATDLHTSRLSQRIVMQAISDPTWAARLDGLTAFYRDRRDAFAEALTRHLGPLAKWDTPPGGLFFWLRLRKAIDTRLLLDESLARGVAFMPGEEFFPNEPLLGTIRLNFTHAGDDTDRGLSILADLLAEHAL